MGGHDCPVLMTFFSTNDCTLSTEGSVSIYLGLNCGQDLPNHLSSDNNPTAPLHIASCALFETHFICSRSVLVRALSVALTELTMRIHKISSADCAQCPGMHNFLARPLLPLTFNATVTLRILCLFVVLMALFESPGDSSNLHPLDST